MCEGVGAFFSFDDPDGWGGGGWAARDELEVVEGAGDWLGTGDPLTVAVAGAEEGHDEFLGAVFGFVADDEAEGVTVLVVVHPVAFVEVVFFWAHEGRDAWGAWELWVWGVGGFGEFWWSVLEAEGFGEGFGAAGGTAGVAFEDTLVDVVVAGRGGVAVGVVLWEGALEADLVVFSVSGSRHEGRFKREAVEGHGLGSPASFQARCAVEIARFERPSFQSR